MQKTRIQSKCLSKLTSCCPNISSFSLLSQQWHEFSIPELQNFLAFLEKEEADRVRAVEQKYSVYRQKLQQALRQHDPATCHPLRPGRLEIRVEIRSQTTEGAELVSHTLHPDMQMTHTLSQAQDPTDSPPPSSKRP